MKYLENLIRDCDIAKNAKPIARYTVNCFDEVPDIKSGIYIIRQVMGDPETTFESFVCFKKTKQKACSKVNKPSKVLYVGSSTTGLKKRLKQHLVKCPDKTYALHLYAWFRGDYEIDILQYDEEIKIIQLIEDGISYDLAPAFGKQGGNNK